MPDVGCRTSEPDANSDKELARDAREELEGVDGGGLGDGRGRCEHVACGVRRPVGKRRCVSKGCSSPAEWGTVGENRPVSGEWVYCAAGPLSDDPPASGEWDLPRRCSAELARA